MKKLSRPSSSPTVSLNDHRLTRTTPVDKLPIDIKDWYAGTTLDVAMASIINAIYTNRSPVFALTSRQLARLMSEDCNTTRKYTGKINGKLYSDVIQHMLGDKINLNQEIGDIASPNFVRFIDGKAQSRKNASDLWTLSGEYLEFFWEEFPALKQHYELLKERALRYYGSLDEEAEKVPKVIESSPEEVPNTNKDEKSAHVNVSLVTTPSANTIGSAPAAVLPAPALPPIVASPTPALATPALATLKQNWLARLNNNQKTLYVKHPTDVDKDFTYDVLFFDEDDKQMQSNATTVLQYVQIAKVGSLRDFTFLLDLRAGEVHITKHSAATNDDITVVIYKIKEIEKLKPELFHGLKITYIAPIVPVLQVVGGQA